MPGDTDDHAKARTHTERDYARLKAAARRLCKRLGGLESAAAFTRASFQTLARYQNVNDPAFMPADVIADLETEAEQPVVTRALADLNGHLLVAKPPAHLCDAAWAGEVGAVFKECGEACAKLGEALAAGGTITADESRDMELRREIAEAMAKLATVDAHLAIVEQGPAAGTFVHKEKDEP